MSKRIYIVFMLSSFFIVSFSVGCQNIKLLSGNLDHLKDQSSFNIRFTYDSITIGDDIPEKTYLRELRRRWEEKEPGRGAYFVKIWYEDRKGMYEPTFIQNFKKYANVNLGDINAPYTVIVKTQRIEGGWTFGVLNLPGEINGELWIVESADQHKVKAILAFNKIRGKNTFGGDFEMTTRLQDAYLFAGKGLGYYLKRKSK